MANTLQTQQLIERQLAFAWEASPGIGDHIKWDNELIGAQNQTGATVSLRRPSRIRASVTGLESAGANDLPGVTQPGVGYSASIDAVVPVTLTTKVEANIQASMEELTYKFQKDPDQTKRFIEPAIVSIKDQINYELAKFVSLSCGNVVTTSSYSTFAQNYLASLGSARSLLVQRGGASVSTERILVAGMDVAPQIGASAATNFNFGNSIRGAQDKGGLVPELGGAKLFESPLLHEYTMPAAVTPTVAAPSGNVTNGVAAGYASTFQVNITGAAASTLYPAGTRWAFTGVYWIVPTTQQSTGKQATFVQTADVTTNGSGAATLTLAEAITYGGDFRNTTLTTAIPTGTTMSIVGAGTAFKPSFLLTRDAVIGVSPKVALPTGLPYAKNFKTSSGFQFALIEDRWPGTLQNITKLVAFVGFGAPKPEGMVAIV